MESLSQHESKARGLLRIVTSLLFIEHGTQKFFNFPPTDMEMNLGGLMLVAAILETFGGLLMLVGFLTRPVAFVLSGFMAAAYWMAHAPQSFYPVNNMGDAAILYCFVFLFFVFAGAGAWSVDASRGKA